MIATLLIPLAAFLLLALVAWTRDLRVSFSDSFFPALAIGVVAGITSAAATGRLSWSHWVLPAVLVAGCLLLRWQHVDEDYVDGILTGTLAGAAAAVFRGLESGPAESTAVVLEGAIAGFSTHIVLFRFRMFGVIAGLAAAAILATMGDAIENAFRRADWSTPFIAVVAIAIVALLLTVFQLRRLLPELEEESRLGVIPEREVRAIANPWKRLRMDGWQDRKARQEFIRLTTELAVRKLRQRRMPAATARLYHLEVLKLRQVVQEIFSVELSVRQSNRSEQGHDDGSDRMSGEKVTNRE